MAQAVVDPAELRRFAQNLRHFNTELHNRMAVIHGQLSVQAVQDSLALILGGPFTLVFWVFFLGLGLLLPLGIEIRETLPSLLSNASVHFNKPLAAVAAVLVLAGGFLLRYIFVYAGQMSTLQ